MWVDAREMHGIKAMRTNFSMHITLTDTIGDWNDKRKSR